MAIRDPPEIAPPPPHAWRIWRSFGYAFAGLGTIVRTQPNFWVHALAAVCAIVLSVALRLSTAEVALVVLTIALVLVIEAVNTTVETMCDLVEPRFNPIVKRAKDISAAAVLIAAAAAVIVALLLFAPRLFALFR